MISVKKGIFVLLFGIGAAISFSAWALPDCQTCKGMQAACQGGDANSCANYTKFRCESLYPEEFCYYPVP